MIDPELRIGVVGATGAVGRVTLQYLLDRGYTNIRAFASLALGGRLARRARDRGGDRRRARRRRPRRLLLLDRDTVEPRARPGRGRRRRDVHRQVLGVPPRSRASRSSCPRSTASERSSTPDRREPELLHDPAHDGARAAARSRWAAERPSRDVPVRVGRRLRRRSTTSAPRGPTTTAPDGLGVRRRRVRRGGQASRGDAQDPRAPRPPGERDVRPRSGRRRPRGGGVDRDGDAARAADAERILGEAPGLRVEEVPAHGDAIGVRRRARRSRSRRSVGGERPRALRRLRQPPQGRRPQRDPDRRARSSARASRATSAPRRAR